MAGKKKIALYYEISVYYNDMSHISGTYTFTFSRLEPLYDNSLKTGCTSLVVGMNCLFSGVDQNDQPIDALGAYVDGTTGFTAFTDPIPDYPVSGVTGASGYSVCYSPDYVSENISGLANEFASGLGWLSSLSGQIDAKLHTPVRWTDFPYPSGSGTDIYPPVNPDDA